MNGTMNIIGCAQAFGESTTFVLSHIYLLLIFIFAPLNLCQYLSYIDNQGVKSFVLVAIELLVFLFTFRCMV